MTCSIAVVCEADADRRAATLLSDRVLCQTIEWISPETLPYLRRYRGLGDQAPYLKCSSVKEIARRRRVVVHGFVGGEPRKPDAAMAERALVLLATSEVPPGAVILTRDTDKERARRDGYDQARRAQRWPFVIIVGIAETKRECWILAGYELATMASERSSRASARNSASIHSPPRSNLPRARKGQSVMPSACSTR